MRRTLLRSPSITCIAKPRDVPAREVIDIDVNFGTPVIRPTVEYPHNADPWEPLAAHLR